MQPLVASYISSLLQETATTYETSARLHPKEQVMLTRITFNFEVRDTKFQKSNIFHLYAGP